MAERRFFNNTQLRADTDDDHAKVASIAQGLGIPAGRRAQRWLPHRNALCSTRARPPSPNRRLPPSLNRSGGLWGLLQRCHGPARDAAASARPHSVVGLGKRAEAVLCGNAGPPA